MVHHNVQRHIKFSSRVFVFVRGPYLGLTGTQSGGTWCLKFFGNHGYHLSVGIWSVEDSSDRFLSGNVWKLNRRDFMCHKRVLVKLVTRSRTDQRTGPTASGL